MVFLAKLVGVLIMGLGFVIFASPAFTQELFHFFRQGKRIYYAGVFRAGVGLVLFLSASQSSVPLAGIALGLMFLVSGIAVFAAEPEKMKSFMEAFSQMPALVIRLFGLVAASFGMLIFSIF